MAVRFIADTHLGHKNIYKFRPVFKSTLHNDIFFTTLLETVITKRDIVYFLGDIIFDKKYLNFIKNLNCTKTILIAGNHCSENISMSTLANTFDEIHGIMKYKEFWLSHAPIHPVELRGKKNIHGHVHDASVNDINYLNVSVDSTFMNYYPRTIEEVREAFKHMVSTNTIYEGIKSNESESVMLQNKETKEIYEYSLLESRKIII